MRAKNVFPYTKWLLQAYRNIAEANKANNIWVTKPPPPSDHEAVVSPEAAHNILRDL